MAIKKGNQKLLPLKRRLRTNPTRAEQLLWAKLRHNQIHGLKFRRQHGIGSYIVDFFCPERSLVIEVDGDVHAAKTQQTKDLERENYLKSLGLQVVRYTNDEVIKNLDGVLEDLSSRVSKASTSLNLAYCVPKGATVAYKGRRSPIIRYTRIHYSVSFLNGRR